MSLAGQLYVAGKRKCVGSDESACQSCGSVVTVYSHRNLLNSYCNSWARCWHQFRPKQASHQGPDQVDVFTVHGSHSAR